MSEQKFRIEFKTDKADAIWCPVAKSFDTIEDAEKYIHQELSSFAYSARIIQCEVVREHKVLMA